uniref:Uncharacterized protein n=1 Tax=Arundo donax TaxID=35708 RepID=A0A0A8Z935_ARUDO
MFLKFHFVFFIVYSPPSILTLLNHLFILLSSNKVWEYIPKFE